MTHHVLRYEQGHMPSAIVNRYSQAQHVGHDGGRPGPRSDNGLAIAALGSFNLFGQFMVYVRPLFDRPGHNFPLPHRSALLPMPVFKNSV